MKNIFRCLMAAAIMFGAVSCANNDAVEPIAPGEEVTTTLTLNLADLGTRLAGDADHIDKVVWGIYNHTSEGDGAYLAPHSSNGKPVDFDGEKAEIEVRLFTGKKYDLVFFAYCSDTYAYEIDWEKRIFKVSYQGDANDECRDAFFHIENGFTAGPSKTFTLRRPFAQLNAGQSYEDYNNMQLTDNYICKSALKTSAYTQMSLVTGAVIENSKTEVIYTLADVIKEEDNAVNDDLIVKTKNASGQEVTTSYKHLSMNYLLVNQKENVDVEFTFVENEMGGVQTTFVRPYYNIPLQRNFRTNVLGMLISAPSTFTVIIDPIFGGDYNIGPWDGSSVAEPKVVNNVYQIETAEELAYFFGKNIDKDAILLNNIDLNGATITPIGYGSQVNTSAKFVFDGNNKSISNFKVVAAGANDNDGGLFGVLYNDTVKDLTIIAANIVTDEEDNYVGAVAGKCLGNVLLENVTVKKSVVDGVNKVGGLVGFAADQCTLTVKNCQVIDSTIKNAEAGTRAATTDEAGLTGGLVGHYATSGKEALIENSKVVNTQMIVTNSRDSKDRANGYLVGGVQSATKLTIKNCEWDAANFSQSGVTNYVSPWENIVGGDRSDNCTVTIIVNNEQIYPVPEVDLTEPIDGSVVTHTLEIEADTPLCDECPSLESGVTTTGLYVRNSTVTASPGFDITADISMCFESVFFNTDKALSVKTIGNGGSVLFNECNFKAGTEIKITLPSDQYYIVYFNKCSIDGVVATKDDLKALCNVSGQTVIFYYK